MADGTAEHGARRAAGCDDVLEISTCGSRHIIYLDRYPARYFRCLAGRAAEGEEMKITKADLAYLAVIIILVLAVLKG